MSRFHISIVVSGISLVVLVSLHASPAPARGLHIRIGGGPLGIFRSVASLAVRGLHGRHYAGRSDHLRLAALRDDAMLATPRGDLTRSADWVTRPMARVQVAAGAALAGWHGHRGVSGWWQHGDGGYGWVGPLFWPFAYYDIYDYTLWGDGMGFWGYGYRDIYAAIFTPYGEDELERYMAPSRNRRYGRVPSLAKICGDDAGEVASLPIEQVRQAIQPTDEQRVALGDLSNASVEAAQIIRAACPTEVALTPAGRLAAMQRRLEAMEAAVTKIRPSLEKIYEQLEDEQKAKLIAFANQRSQSAPKVPATQSCTPPEALQWPVREIEARLNLNDAQRAELKVLQHMSERANNILNFDCQPDEDLTPPDRLATADVRLDAMLDAIKLVRPALEDFFAALSDEQKAQFATIGAKRTS